MTSLARRTQVRNDRRYTTARGSRQGRDLERNSVWILKGTGVVGSLEMPLPSCFHQNPMANGGLAPRSREVISSAFHELTGALIGLASAGRARPIDAFDGFTR